MATLRITGKGQWATEGATITHEKLAGIGWSYVVRWDATPGWKTIWATLSEAMADVGCDSVEVGAREAAELSRD
jgi:hypothetical protein